MKQTILHISKYYHPYLGGIETLVKSMAEGLTVFRNIVVCYATDGKDSVDQINGVTVYRVKVNFSMMSQDVALGYYQALRKLMKEYEPQYVHVHCPNPYVYPLVLKAINPETKLILHWHSDILSKGLIYKFIKPFESVILKRANLIITTSPNYIHPSSPIYKYKEKISIAQSGIVVNNFDLKDNDKERIADIKKQYGNKPIVFLFGRHIPYKGIDWLMKIEKYVKSDCQFIIAGSGPLTNQLKQQNSSPRITFTGRLSTDDLRCYLHAADIFAFTSNTKAEALGLALAEAMYCRSTPIVFHIEGSGVNWVSIKDQTGLEIPLGDLPGYAKAIDLLLTDNSLRERLAEAAHQRVIAMFTEQKSVSIMEDIYKRL